MNPSREVMDKILNVRRRDYKVYEYGQQDERAGPEIENLKVCVLADF
jgi:hypothetical protein